MRKALIRQADGFVQNVIEIEVGAGWQPPIGYILIDAAKTGSPGDTWDGTKFTRPLVVGPEPIRDLEAEIDKLKADVAALNIKAGI